MRSFVFALLVWVLCAEERGRIAGQVVNSVTGGGVRKAHVRFELVGQRGGHEVQTDAAGKFIAAEMMPGEYRVSAWATGYVSVEQDNVMVRGEKTGVAIKLTPQGVIAGRVLDEDGDPVMNARVLAVPFRRSVGMGGDNGETVQTNDLGEFRLNRLRPGRYFVLAAASTYFTSEDGPSPSTARVERQAEEWTYHPAATDMESATPLRVTAGSELRGVEIRLRRSRALRLAGRLEGFPTGGWMWVRLRAKSSSATLFDESERTVTPVGDDGRFEFPKVPPREYTLFANAAAPNGEEARGKASVRLDTADVTDLVVRPDVTVRIAGVAKGSANDKPVWVALKPEMDSAGECSERVGEDHRFAMQVAQGRYRLELRGEASSSQFLEAAEFNGQDVLKEGVEVSTPGELVLTVGERGGTVAGSVELPEKAVRQTLVLLWPSGDERLQRHRYKIQDVKRDGAFEIPGVAPGRYRMIAIQPPAGDRNALFTAGYLKVLEDKAEEVEVAAAGRVMKDLKVVALSEFE